MFAQRAADFVLKSSWRAGLLALVFRFAPLLICFSYMIVGFVTLRKGPKEGLMVVLWALLPVFAALLSDHTPWQSLAGLSIFLVIGNYFFLVLMAWVLNRTQSWALVLELSVLLSILVAVLLHLLIGDPLQSLWQTELLRLSDVFAKQGYSLFYAQNVSWVPTIASYMTGGLLASYTLFNLSNLLLSRYWQALVFNPGGLKKELEQCRLSHIMVLLLLFGVVGLLLGWGWVKDFLPVLLMVFAVVGGCVVHHILAKSGSGKWPLILFYGLIFFFALYVAPFLVVIGVLNSGFDVKRLFIK